MEVNYIFLIVQGSVFLVGFGIIYGMIKITLNFHGKKLENIEKSVGTMNKEMGEIRDRISFIEGGINNRGE